MKISEKDRDGEEHDVAWVSHEETDKFDDLGKPEHEDDLRPEGILPACGIPVCRCLPERENDEWVHHKSQGREGGDMQRICAPRLLAVTRSVST